MAARPRRLSCGVVVVRQTPEGARFLLLRAFRHWDFPKGMNERGEDPLDTAIREVREETTVGDLEFDFGKEFVETGPYNRGKVARYYLARTEQSDIDLPIAPELGCPEHNEYRWVDFDEAVKLTSPRLQPVLMWAANVLRLDVTSTENKRHVQSGENPLNERKTRAPKPE